MIVECDWCMNRVERTGIFTHGSNWDIFEDVCDECTLKILTLRKTVNKTSPRFEMKGGIPATTEGWRRMEEMEKELEEEYEFSI